MATSDLCEVLKRHQQQHSTVTASTTTPGGGGGGVGTAGLGTTTTTTTTTSTLALDASTERQICTAVLRLLHDKSNDVQAIAVKTLGVLLTTVQQEQVGEIADSLADQVLDASKSELRDVYAIGLRTLLKTIPNAYGNSVSARLVTRLLEGCRVDKDDITLACLDALTDLLTRFGLSVSVVRQHDAILQMCLKQLGTSDHAVVRKRAGTTLGCLAVVLSDALLHRMVEAILGQMETFPPNSDATRALIRTTCTIAGAVGHRLGQAQIDRIVPIFLKFTLHASESLAPPSSPSVSHHHDASDHGSVANSVALNELRESCFLGFESFVLRCPKQVDPHLQLIVQATLVYMSYDPNYSYGDEDDEEDDENQVVPEDTETPDEAMDDDEGGEGGDDDEDVDEDDDEYEEDEEEDDDDDESWKVRRSAIRALKAVVEAHRHNPTPLWKHKYPLSSSGSSGQRTTTVAAALVRRFKEREENCRVGVLDCFTRLLAVTIQAPPGVSVLQGGPGDDDAIMTDSGGDPALVIPIRTYYAPKLVTATQTIFASKSNERSKSAAMALLSTLCKVPGGLGGAFQIHKVFSHMKGFLQLDTAAADHKSSGPLTAGVAVSHHLGGGGSKALRLDALSLVHAVLASDQHRVADVRKNLPVLLPSLCCAVKEQWYKVIAEALRAIASVPKFYNPDDGVDDNDPATRQQVALQLYDAVMPLLAAHDVDQEIKECALKACACLLSSLHDSLPSEKLSHLLQLLLERLQNETTRLSAMKTVAQVAKTVDVSTILADSISTLAGFLKLASRSLKQSSLEALDVLIVHHGRHESLQGGELYSSVLQDCAPLVVDSDLHLSHLSL